MPVEEAIAHVRQQQPSVERIKRTTGKKQSIPPVTEAGHNNARITRPNPTETAIFSNKTMLT
jgi:hypothetical protein